MPKDAITLLKGDHKTVESLFKRFEKLGDGAKKSKRQIGEQIIRELSIHAAIEEQALYPVIRGCSDELEKLVLEALEEHHVAKWVLSELDGMDPEHERFDAKFSVLMESVRHHVKEEEQELFPKVRKALDRKLLGELGDALTKAKKAAPTRPHPRASDTPPGNVVSGAVSGLADRVRDFARGVREDADTVARRTSRTSSRSTSRSSGSRSTGSRSTGSARRAPASRSSRASRRTTTRS